MILRAATFADEKILLDWRNDPTVREVSSNAAEFSAESHRVWLHRMITSQEAWLYVAEVNGLLVGKGQIERAFKHLSPKMDTVLIGYSVQRDLRGNGYGMELAALLVQAAKGLGYPTVSCRIKRSNERSVIVALRAGVNAIEIF
jgi:RimJ/RimL family protein N-acetyltransferase